MSCVFKIREGLSSDTEAEKKIARYILAYPNETTLSSAQNLGEKAGVSAAAVIRFSHKLGYKGFTALKVDLAHDSTDEIKSFDDVIQENDSMSVVVKKAERLNSSLQDQVYRLLNVENLEKAVNALLKCRTVYLFGVSGSGIVCMDFREKLTRINHRAFYRSDFHDQLAAAAHMTGKDAALAVSYSGKTREVVIGMKYAKEKGVPTIAITQFQKSPLLKQIDIPLYIPTTEHELRLGAIASRNASLIVTALLYMGMAKNDINSTKDDLIKTREIIRRMSRIK